METVSTLVVTCPYCLKPAVLEDSAVVYRWRSYGMIWRCAPCDAYVGTHKGSVDHKPLGRLANRELREWKKAAHRAFDPVWKTGRGVEKMMSRRVAYARFAQVLGMRELHIGWCDVEQCKRLIEAVEKERSDGV